MKYTILKVILFVLASFIVCLPAKAATNVFYSVGQNTTDHKTGSPTVTISSGVATFSVAQTATNMGVGDKVTYNTNSVAYISSKVSTSQWNVITATGGTPADISNSTVVSIAHAFSSLNAALTGASGASYLNTTNLVTGNYLLNIPVYYDSGTDTTAVTVTGFTTGASNYVRIYTPFNTSTEVNQSQRHAGIWNNSLYKIIPSSNPFAATVEVAQSYTRIDGLQISPYNSSNRNGINVTADFVTVSNCIIKGGGSDNAGIRLDTGVNTAFYAYNIIMYNLGTYGFYEGLAAGPNFYLYNTTIYNVPTSVTSYGASLVAKNVLSYSSTNGFVGTYNVATSTNNASSLSNNAQGINARNSVTVSFVNAASGDFHILSTDVGVLNFGANLSSDPYLAFTTDIDNETRAGTWDIGADEYIDTTAPSIPTGLSASAVSTTQIDLTWNASTDDVGVTGYKIYRDSVQVGTSAGTSYSDTGLTQNTLYSYTVAAYDAGNNTSSQSSASTATTQADVTAPTRSAGAPSGQLDPSTTSTTISLTTDENATCKYSTSASVSYASMTNTFGTTGGTSQSTTVSGLSDGNTYTYYIRCLDSYGNSNSSDYSISFSIGIAASAKSDFFSWETRTDRYNKPAGIFTTTPFPIDENSTSYTVRNDENPNGKTYYLGTKYYVDGAYVGGNNDGSWSKPFTSISSAISSVSAGNVTIVVRGAHDSFNGIYTESSGFATKAGTDDTHRFTITGYLQERPIIDGNNSTSNIVRSTATTNAYVTIQRLKIQNSKGQGLRLGNTSTKLDKYFNVIDVEFYNTANDTLNNPADSNAYFLNTDNAWIFHVTSHHTLGHCIKAGDNADNIIIEWTITYECGYWTGIVAEKNITDWSLSPATHPTGIDLPSDSGQDEQNFKVRYNIVYDTLFYGIQLRNASNFSAHHNEVYNTPHFDDVTGSVSGVTGSPQVLLYGNGAGNVSSGEFYSNVVRDSSDANSSGVLISGLANDHTISVYNNLIYNNPLGEIYLYGYIDVPGSTRTINIFNNVLWHNSNVNPTFYGPSNFVAGEVHMKNNIMSQLGSQSILALDVDITDYDYNLYYYPSGTLGDTAGSHDYASGASTDPVFVSNPSGTYVWGMGNIATNSGAKNAGKNLGTVFLEDFNMVQRPQGSAWDIGMNEFSSGDLTKPNISSFVMPSESNTLNVSITSFSATDNVGVTGYLVNESSATPSLLDSGWALNAQSSYTFSTIGAKTLYAWVKDAADNISNSLNASVTIYSIPTVITSSAGNIGQTSAVLAGSISVTGGYDSTSHGFAYGTSADLSTVIATTTGGSFSGTGSFVSSQANDISSLTCGTTYYYRAYATNSVGTGYGSISSFSTSACSVAVSSGGGGGGGGGGGILPIYRNTMNVIVATSSPSLASTTISGIMRNYVFRADIKIGDDNQDVKKLQIYLNNSGFLVSTVGAGSTGKETTYFGAKTFQALKKYQKYNKISSTGYFGPITRSQVNKILGTK